MSTPAPAAPAVTGSLTRATGRSRAAWPWTAAVVAGLLALPLIPGLDNNFTRSLLTQMAIAAVFALSYNTLLGQTGLLSFGHAVYFGLGGYTAIHAMRLINAGWPVPIALVPLFGAAGGLLSGLTLGAVSTRRGGTVFAMITLGIGELVVAASLMLTGFFGGEEGITANRTRGPHVLGLTLKSQLEVYYLVLLWTLASVALLYFFTRTPVGRLCNAVRDNAERAEFIGYNPRRVRFFAIMVAAVFAGVAGGLHAINYEIVAAEALGAARSGSVLLMAFIGGMGHFAGPILGAIVITWLQVSLSDFSSAWQLYLGVFFIVIVLFAPGGLAGLLAMHGPVMRHGAVRALIPGYVLAAVPGLVMATGGAFLLEIAYRISTKPELGTRMTMLGVAFDAGRPWPWLGGVVVAVGGWWLFRRTWPVVAAGWQRAGELAGRGDQ